MKKNKLIIGLLSVATVASISACSGSSDDNEVQNIDIVDTSNVEIDTMERIVEYSVPTPNELFEIIKLQGGKQQLNLVNPLENSSKYVDTKAKSINFGVYSADIAYLSCFGIGVDFLKYFKKIEELGEELGISGAFDEDMMDRIENNEGNSDSLFSISNDSYYDSYLYLEENEKGSELSLIMAGGFVESLYIITNLVNKYDEADPIIKKIGDQKIVLENLLDFIFQYSDDESVAAVIDDLAGLADIFESKMTFEESSTSVKNNEGTLMLSGGGTYVMNADAFNAIKTKAKELRDKYTN